MKMFLILCVFILFWQSSVALTEHLEHVQRPEWDLNVDLCKTDAVLYPQSNCYVNWVLVIKAFIKLESIENLTKEQRDAYEELALDIFTKHSPKDARGNKAECTGCETMIPDWSQVCPNCDTKFPTCIVNGRPLMEYQFWMCGTCKHRAYEQEISTLNHCPLCHAPI